MSLPLATVSRASLSHLVPCKERREKRGKERARERRGEKAIRGDRRAARTGLWEQKFNSKIRLSPAPRLAFVSFSSFSSHWQERRWKEVLMERR